METVLRGQAWPGTHYPQCTSVQLYNAIKTLLLHYSLLPVHHIILPPQGGERERLSELWTNRGQERRDELKQPAAERPTHWTVPVQTVLAVK